MRGDVVRFARLLIVSRVMIAAVDEQLSYVLGQGPPVSLLRQHEPAVRRGDVHAAMDAKAARREEWLEHPPGVALKAALISQLRRPDRQALQDVIGQQ
jgi:hypothetical protein